MAARLKLSIVIPALNEAARIGAALAGARAAARAAARGDRGRRRQRRRHAPSLPSRCATGSSRRAARPRGADERRRARARRATRCFSCTPTRVCPPDADALISACARHATCGDASTCEIEGRHPLLRVVACAMNLRSRLTGIATGDQAIFVRRDAFPGFPEIAADGGHRLQPGDEAARRARLPARAGAHLGPALGDARRAAHRSSSCGACACSTTLGAPPERLARLLRA